MQTEMVDVKGAGKEGWAEYVFCVCVTEKMLYWWEEW